MSEDRNRHIVPPLDVDKLVVLDGIPKQVVEPGSSEHEATMLLLGGLIQQSNLADDIKAMWRPELQRPSSEMQAVVEWPDSPKAPREIKSKKPKVSQADAEQVLQALKLRWPEQEGWSHVDGPTLYSAEHEEMPKGCWSIAWEGGPEDWTMIASQDIKKAGVFLEPMTSWCLGLYPEVTK